MAQSLEEGLQKIPPRVDVVALNVIERDSIPPHRITVWPSI